MVPVFRNHNKQSTVNDAFPFGKHCDFLEGIACLHIGMSLLTEISQFSVQFHISGHQNHVITNEVIYINLAVNQRVPLNTGCRSIP